MTANSTHRTGLHIFDPTATFLDSSSADGPHSAVVSVSTQFAFEIIGIGH